MSADQDSFWIGVARFSETSSPLDFVLILQHYDKFLWGCLMTLQLTFLSLLFGGALAIPLAIARADRHRIWNGPIWCFTYFFRGTPLLVQTYFIYYGLGQFEFVRDSVLWQPILSKAYWCALIAFVLNTAAYEAELFRGAIESIPKGEIEAAKACGFSKRKRLFRIILPGAFRRAIPAYSNEVIFMLHGSAVASAVTLQDILGVGRWLNGRYYVAYEGFITAAILYMILVFGISRIFRFIEKRWLAHLRPREQDDVPAPSIFEGARI